MSMHARSRLPGVALLVVVASASASCESTDGAADSERGIPRIALEQDLRIDAYEHDLVPVDWLAVSSTGVIALFQRQDFTVRFFDSNGAFLKSVGAVGEGPGEFRRLIRGGWIADTLWVSDTQLRRAVLISPELEFVRSVRNHDLARPLPEDTARFTTYRGPSPYAMYGDGGSMVWGIRPVDDSSVEELGGSPILRLTPDGFIRNLVGVIPRGAGGSAFVMTAGGGGFSMAIPFYPRQSWQISAHGTRFAVLSTDMSATPSYRVFVADAAGQVVFDRSFGFEPEPIPQSVKDSVINLALERRDQGVRAELESLLRDSIPNTYPEAVQVMIGMDERVWVGAGSRPDGTRWLVLSPTGDPEGEVLLPPGVTPSAADAEHVWCVEVDERNVQSVVRYRLRPESASRADGE